MATMNSKPGDLIGFNLTATAPNGFITDQHYLRISETFTIGQVMDCVVRFQECKVFKRDGYTVSVEPVIMTDQMWATMHGCR